MAYRELKLWRITGEAYSQTANRKLEYVTKIASDLDLSHAIDLFIEFHLPAKMDVIRKTEYLGKVYVARGMKNG